MTKLAPDLEASMLDFLGKRTERTILKAGVEKVSMEALSRPFVCWSRDQEAWSLDERDCKIV